MSETDALTTVADLMCLAARTAPKTRGVDVILTLTTDQATRDRIKELSKPGGMWDCTHCGECVERCPKPAEPFYRIKELMAVGLQEGVTNNIGARHAPPREAVNARKVEARHCTFCDLCMGSRQLSGERAGFAAAMNTPNTMARSLFSALGGGRSSRVACPFSSKSL